MRVSWSCGVSFSISPVFSVVFFQPKMFANLFVSTPHVNSFNGHSPLYICDHIISAVGIPNRARFFPKFFSLLPSLVNKLNALFSILNHTKANHPIMAIFPTPHQNCF